ncbi:porin [Rhodovulum tesquicola]|uniref:porin n=1 Tax=Rhodovulum tesquicola TaxID=540254 RepID=UPI002097E9F3|nr:porin [Rhodovulum tesquicola]MCO8144823.1 porin [Rhodovulum tesquicola]
MKKVLFATTALVASAGIASADITFSGTAEMGIVGGGADNFGNAAGGETQFHNSTTLSFSASTETDMGITVGMTGRFDMDGTSNENDAPAFDNETMFISGSFGTLTLGDTDGAMDKVLVENVGNPGSLQDDETIHAGYLGAFGDGAYDDQVLRYDYAFGDFGFSVSMELDDSGTVDDGYAVGVSYKTSMTGVDLGFGLAYQTLETDGTWAPGNLEDFIGPLGAGLDVDIWGVSVNADFQNGFVAGLVYSDWDIGGVDADHIGLSMGYTMNAWSFGANWGRYDIDGDDADGFGLAVAYDLGGGASVHLGYGDSDVDGVPGNYETWSFGVAMKF